jgi:hypothetical protein
MVPRELLRSKQIFGMKRPPAVADGNGGCGTSPFLILPPSLPPLSRTALSGGTRR